jgi:hypothetical protein
MREQIHHHLDALVCSLLVVVLGALNGVEETITVIRNTYKYQINPE